MFTINNKHIKFVENVARGYTGYGLPQEDIIQAGCLGLVKASKKYDKAKNDNFLGYATHYVRSEINEYVQWNFHDVFIPKTKPMKKLFFNFRKLRKQFGYVGEAEMEDIAERLGVKVEEVRIMNTIMSTGMNTYRLFHEPEEDEEPKDDIYLRDNTFGPDHLLMEYEEDNLIKEEAETALSSLNERQRDIIESRVMVDEGEKAVGLKDLANKYGVSAEAIRQNEARAINKMREAFSA